MFSIQYECVLHLELVSVESSAGRVESAQTHTDEFNSTHSSQVQSKRVRYLSARLRCGDAQQSQRHLTHDQITDQLPVLLHVLTDQRHRAVHHLTVTHTHTVNVYKHISHLFQVTKMFINVLLSKYYFSQLRERLQC